MRGARTRLHRVFKRLRKENGRSTGPTRRCRSPPPRPTRRSLRPRALCWSAMPPHRIDESVAFVPVRIAVLTVSDTRDASNDTSGDALAARLAEAGHVLAARALLRDDAAQIAAQLRRWIGEPGIDVVIS